MSIGRNFLVFYCWTNICLPYGKIVIGLTWINKKMYPIHCYCSLEGRLIRKKFFSFSLQHEYTALAASCDFFIFKIIFFSFYF